MTLSFSQLFAINGQWLYPPSNYQEEVVPEVGITLSGNPIRQGYPSFTFVWDFLHQESVTALFAVYANGAAPSVAVTYIDKETGNLRNMAAKMHEPVIGSRNAIFYQNVTLTFSKCIPA